MLADVRRGAVTEIDFMNSQIVLRGQRFGVPTPVNTALVEMIKELEQTNFVSSIQQTELPQPVAGHITRLRAAAANRIPRTTIGAPTRRYSTSAAGPIIAGTIEEMRTFRHSTVGHREKVGFVPTMGALHAGHLSLVAAAKNRCERVVVSIFVNPTQFAAHEDLSKYPRTFEKDYELLRQASVDAIFYPKDAKVMYPDGFSLSIDVPDATQKKEGWIRPTHFNGVATVCLKLFNIVQPDFVFFGQKDAQQCATIRQLVRDFNVPTNVVIVPTSRDPDGLAMSSRNVYLSPDERQAGLVLYRTLKMIEGKLLGGATNDAESLRQAGMTSIIYEPMADPQYVSVADQDTMAEIHGRITPEQLRKGLCIAVAAKFGKTRLIDNIIVQSP